MLSRGSFSLSRFLRMSRCQLGRAEPDRCLIGGLNYNCRYNTNLVQQHVCFMQSGHMAKEPSAPPNTTHTTTKKTNTTVRVYTDASGSHGFGCVWGNQWTAGRWRAKLPAYHKANTTYLEAYAILVAVKAWSHDWSKCSVTVFCDNTSVVRGFNKKIKISNAHVKKVYDTIAKVAQKHKFQLEVIQLTAKEKKENLHQAADALSKGKMNKLTAYLPEANDKATELPSDLDMMEYSPTQ